MLRSLPGAAPAGKNDTQPVPSSYDDSSIGHVRVLDAVAHFAQSLPYRVRCSDDLDRGLAWAPRGVAMLHHEIAPDPAGWRTALRFDIDCPCDRRPHEKSGYCPRAATFWRDAGLPEPSFVVKNPANGHAHYVYLLRGWIRIDGNDATELPAVRYYAAIERAYTRALHADPGYASLVHHNPFSRVYETTVGPDTPYSLSELAAFVTLASTPRRHAPDIRTDGRNVETFDRLRFWAYAQVGEWRCGTYDDWSELVAKRALEIAALVRSSHATPSHAFTDFEALDTAKSVARWVWQRYDGANLTLATARSAARRRYDKQRALARRRTAGCVPRTTYLAQAQARRERACSLRAMGLAVDEIARRLGAGVRSVYRWITELRSVPCPSTPSDFESKPPLRTPQTVASVAKEFPENIDGSLFFGPDAVPIDDRHEVGSPTRSVDPHDAKPIFVQESSEDPTEYNQLANSGRSVVTYIQARIANIVAGMRKAKGFSM